MSDLTPPQPDPTHSPRSAPSSHLPDPAPGQPSPTQTAAGPAYDGRLLPRPHEEVVDQGLSFDVGTLLSRRFMLRAVGVGAGASLIAACSRAEPGGGENATATTPSGTPSTSSASTSSASPTSSSGLVEIPDETAGPFPGDGSNGPDALSQTGIVRQDIRSSFAGASGRAEGVPLTLELTVLDLAKGGGGFAGAAVYVWHCDRDGNYSMYSGGVEDQNYLRGVQLADSDGVVRFTTIFPACYSGRWPHVHFEVYPTEGAITDSTKAISTSQLAFPQSVCDAVYAVRGYEQSVRTLSQVTLDSDGVFGEDSAAHQMASMTGDVTKGYAARLTVPIDTRTEPTRERGPGPR